MKDNNPNYYESQLNRINLSAPTISIKLNDYDGNQTNEFTLNEESIKELLKFVKRLNSKVKSNSKDKNKTKYK
jgi:fructose-1,6-bisphosphatase